jgi:uncharacterized membrane protein
MPSTAIDFHRLMVHFPVALLLLAALFQLLAVWRRSTALQFAAKANLVAGAGLGLCAALFGFVASDEFGDKLLETHELTAFATVAWAVVVAALWLWKPTEPRSRGAFLVLGGLAVAALGVGVTGYLGGHMAHGHGVHGPKAHAASRPVPATPTPETAAPAAAALTPQLVACHSVFAQRCNACHGLDKALQTSLGPADWTALVARMADKTGGAITPEEQASIVQFLTFHSANPTVPLP